MDHGGMGGMGGSSMPMGDTNATDNKLGTMTGQPAPHVSYTCDGAPWMDAGADRSGTWAGHVFAGVALLCWALHWNYGVYKAYLTARQRPYRAQTTYAFPFLPASWPIEPVLKVVIPVGAIFGNLIGSDGWRSNQCAHGTPREGHFDPHNIFRYADVWILFAFMASGLVDLLGWFLELPSGTQHFFTSAAFMLQSFILAESTHADMLEGMVYYMLFLVSAGTAVFMLAEIMWPDSFFTSCGRVYCTYMQAIWFFGAAHILFEGRPAWDTMRPVPDMAPAGFVPVPFVFWMNFTSLFMFMAYLLMRRVFGAHPGEREGGVERASLIGEDGRLPLSRGLGGGTPGRDGCGVHEMVPLVSKQHF